MSARLRAGTALLILGTWACGDAPRDASSGAAVDGSAVEDTGTAGAAGAGDGVFRGTADGAARQDLRGDALFWMSETRDGGFFNLVITTRSGARVIALRQGMDRPVTGSHAIAADSGFALRYIPSDGAMHQASSGTLTITTSSASGLAGRFEADVPGAGTSPADTVRLAGDFEAVCGAESRGQRCD